MVVNPKPRPNAWLEADHLTFLHVNTWAPLDMCDAEVWTYKSPGFAVCDRERGHKGLHHFV